MGKRWEQEDNPVNGPANYPSKDDPDALPFTE
jgi:hypothetical protein